MQKPELPISGRPPIARHCSYLAALRSQSTRAAKSAQYLAWLRDVGTCTDHGAVEGLGFPLSSVTSIRNGLVNKGLVKAIGSCQGAYRQRLTLWSATDQPAPPLPHEKPVGHDVNQPAPGRLI